MRHRNLLSASALLIATLAPCTAAEIGWWDGKEWMENSFIFNNTWNMGAASGGSWQAVWHNYSQSQSWGAKWSTGSDNWGSVKGYPAMVRGWHWGTWSSNSGLPRQISDDMWVGVEWWTSRNWEGNCRYNQSLDLWVHDSSDPQYNNPNMEIMVWYNWNDVYPIGSNTGNVWLADEQWEKWVGYVNSWTVVTYRKVNQSWGRSTINIGDFLRNAGANWKYLTSIQAGWESFTGMAEWQTNWYGVYGL